MWVLNRSVPAYVSYANVKPKFCTLLRL